MQQMSGNMDLDRMDLVLGDRVPELCDSAFATVFRGVYQSTQHVFVVCPNKSYLGNASALAFARQQLSVLMTPGTTAASHPSLCPYLGLVPFKTSTAAAFAPYAIVLRAPNPSSYLSLYELRRRSKLSLDSGFALKFSAHVVAALSALWYKTPNGVVHNLVHGGLSTAHVYVRVAPDPPTPIASASATTASSATSAAAPPAGDIKEIDLALVNPADVQIAMFGLVGIKSHAQSDESICLSSGFAAPEVIQPFTAASDVYSLGLILASCLSSTGGPYGAQSELAAYQYRLSNPDLTSISGSSPFAITVPNELRGLVMSMTHVNPQMRPSWMSVDSTVTRMLAVTETSDSSDISIAKKSARQGTAAATSAVPAATPIGVAAKPILTNSFAIGSARTEDESDPSALISAPAGSKLDTKSSDVKGLTSGTAPPPVTGGATTAAAGAAMDVKGLVPPTKPATATPATAPTVVDDGSVLFFDFTAPTLPASVVTTHAAPLAIGQYATSFNPYDESNIPCTVVNRGPGLRFPLPALPKGSGGGGSELGAYTLQFEAKFTQLPIPVFMGTSAVSPGAIATAASMAAHAQTMNDAVLPKPKQSDDDDTDDAADAKSTPPASTTAASASTTVAPAKSSDSKSNTAAAAVVAAKAPALSPVVSITPHGGVQLFGRPDVKPTGLNDCGWHLWTIVVNAPRTGSSDTEVRVACYIDGAMVEESVFDAINRRQFLCTSEKGITLFGGDAAPAAPAAGDKKSDRKGATAPAAAATGGRSGISLRSVRLESRALDETDVLNAAVATATAVSAVKSATTNSAAAAAAPVATTASVRLKVVASQTIILESGWNCRNSNCGLLNRVGQVQCMKCLAKRKPLTCKSCKRVFGWCDRISNPCMHHPGKQAGGGGGVWSCCGSSSDGCTFQSTHRFK